MHTFKKNKYEKFSGNRLSDFSEFVEEKNGELTFVEFGVGSGFTLKAIKKKYQNSEIYGFDIYPTNKNVKIIQENLNYFKFSKYKKILKKTDYFLLLDVLEHLIDPMLFLKNLTKYAKKNATIIISCPNFSSLRMFCAWINESLPKEHHGYFDENHLHWFSPISFYNFFGEINMHKTLSKYLFSKNILKKMVQKIYPKRLCSQFIFIVKI